ncbi:nitrite reductase, copper-containing [bacterium]|jgi:nitrite reductase (NO-forming)|nr:nitrite reductase, copper-containing [Balneola sp.]MBR9917673.1 nitrite reductase, copper-containing [bacterium]
MKKSAYILKKIPVLMTVVVILGSTFGINAQDNPDYLKRIKQEMVAPPFLPEFDQVGPKEPVVVEIELTIEEKKLEIAPGVFIWAMTFDGSVPGPMIVVHENDYVELTLINPESNSLQHNIDFHAATGAMGGGDLTVVNPGEEVTMRFKATKSGTFVYHCAPGGMMVPLHVVSGMNGVIMVLPREGLTDNLGEPVTFDKAFYVVEQDYYIPTDEGGDYKEYDFPSEGFGDMMEVFRSLTPSHIVFNGVEGALTGENALRAEVGDKVLFVSAQANRDTRMHLIGGHADLVWNGGSFGDKPSTNYETWAIPGGAAVPMLYEFKQPGTYAYVNHNLIEAMSFGAVGIVEVEGEWNDDLMKQISEPKKIEKKK